MDSRIKVGLIALLFVAGAAGGAALQAGFIPVSQNDSGLPVNVPGGPSATVTGNFDFSNQTGAVDDSTLQYNTSAGSALFESTGDANATLPVSSLDGSWVNLSDVDTTSADLTVRTGEVAPATISGEVTQLRYPEASRIDTTDDGPDIYLAASGSGQITLNNLPASTELSAATASGTYFDTVTTDSSGTATFDISSTSGREGVILFNPHSPQASNLSPADGVELDDPTVNFTVDVADADFPTAQGDSVTAELVLDNQSVGTQTVTSNQTVTITKDLTVGGEHTYHWELSDSYGEVTSTSTRTLSVPSKVTVRSVVGNHSIIDNQSLNISARLYSGELIFQRNVSNGRIDLSNVPVDREYILSVRTDGYYQRTIIISSVYEQSSIYLLPTDTEAVLDIFRLNDRTGKYPTESSKLVIKRALNTTDGGLEWVRVAGDYFGAAGQFKIQLQQDRRYRLVISNSQGDTRVLGHYSTDVAETVILNPVPIGVSLNVNASTYTWDAVRQNDTISFSYHDPKNETTQLHVSIYEQGNASNVVLNQTYLNDPYGTLSVTQPLTGNQTNASWVVEWSAERNGEKISGKVMTSSPREPLVPELADWIKHSLSIIAVIIIGGLFTQLNAAVGGVTTAVVGGGFWFAGWLPNAAGGAIAIALLLSVLVKGAQARGL